MRYYGVKPQHTNPASPNENGDAEQSHHRFKRAVEQALLLRGSREFGSLAAYAQFLKDLFAQRNAGRRARLAEEMALLRELPARRMESAKRERVKVDSGSLIHVERNSYSVNSRLIGARVEARLYLDHVEVCRRPVRPFGVRAKKGRRPAAPARAEQASHRLPAHACVRSALSNAERTRNARFAYRGWCGSQARLRTTGIKRICFRPAGFVWHTMR